LEEEEKQKIRSPAEECFCMVLLLLLERGRKEEKEAREIEILPPGC
jgi:hypothetical protein